MRGIWATYWKCACSWAWALLSCWSPSRSLSSASWGTLHPHPFRSANFVSRKLGSNSCAAGSNGRRKATAGVGSIALRQNRTWKQRKLIYNSILWNRMMRQCILNTKNIRSRSTLLALRCKIWRPPSTARRALANARMSINLTWLHQSRDSVGISSYRRKLHFSVVYKLFHETVAFVTVSFDTWKTKTTFTLR